MMRSDSMRKRVSASPIHIAIVDPDPRMAVLAVLLKPRLAVTVAASAAEALAALKHLAPHIVIVNVDLPDLRGGEFCRILRARFPGCPIVVVTGVESSENLREVTDLPLDGFFRKPVRTDQLIEHLAALLPSRAAFPRLNGYVGRAIEHVAGAYDRSLRLSSVAQAVGVSRTHLAHLFKAQTGVTLGEFILKLRIEISTRLLTHTDDKLECIAETVGFSDGPHFSRMFYRLVGRWPGHFRQMAKARGIAAYCAMQDSRTVIHKTHTAPYCSMPTVRRSSVEEQHPSTP